jgi:hypothetical protein
MAFTVVSATSETTTASTSHVVSMPAGDNTAKVLVLCIRFGAAATIPTPPTNWTQIGSSGSPGIVVFKNTAGTADATVTFTSDNSVRSCHNTHAVTGFGSGIEISAAATATSGTPDSASLTPSWGSKETLWFSMMGVGGHVSADLSAYPTNYTGGVNSDTNGGVIGHALAGTAYRILTAASEDPGSFTVDGTARVWQAFTVAVEPSSAKTLAADAGSYAITGTAASPEMGREVVAGTGSYVITGTAAALSKGLTLAAGAGSYAISGTDAALELGREVAADAGSYAITGTAAGLSRGLPLAAGAGAYSITGVDASLEHGWVVTAGAGSYAITGTAAALELGREVVADAGSYAISGTDATLTVAAEKAITAEPGSYAITGTAASLFHGWVVTAEAGSYAISGTDAALEHGWTVTAGAGSYAITGTDAALEIGYALTAGAGSYEITGTDATLTATTGAAEETPSGGWLPTKAQAKRFRDYNRQLEKAQAKAREDREATERRILESIERAYEDLTQPERAQVVAEAVMAVAPGAVTVIEEWAFPVIDWTVFEGDLEALRGILAHIEQAAWAGLARAQARAVADAAMIAAMNEEMDIEVLLLLAA